MYLYNLTWIYPASVELFENLYGMVNDEKVNDVLYAFRDFLLHKRGSSYQGKKSDKHTKIWQGGALARKKKWAGMVNCVVALSLHGAN